MISYIPLIDLRQDSRPQAFPCFIKNDGSVACTWGDFWRRVNLVGNYVQNHPAERWIIADEQVLPFLVGLLAVLMSGKQACLPRNQTAAARQEIGSHSTQVLSSAGLDGAAGLGKLFNPGPEDEIPDFRPINPENSIMHLFTSGSTGEPKQVIKPIALVEAELANLHALWGADLRGRAVFTTVQHHHFYGLLFYVLSPLCQALPLCVDMVNYPENLLEIQDFQAALVGSPAFYKRLVDADLTGLEFGDKPVLFSSGGALPPAVAQAMSDRWGLDIREIYGSTETGGIAWRVSPEQSQWTAFRGIEVRIEAEELISIRSPYVDPGHWYATADRGIIAADGSLSLLGRSDNVVKIEEKRVSLNEVERRLLESPLVAEARVVAMEDHRQFLAAVLVLNADGQKMLAQQGKLAANNHFRNCLRNWFEATVLPRKWRFVPNLPMDSMGKVAKLALIELFETKPDSGSQLDTGQPDKGIVLESVERQDHKLALDFHVPADSQWVDGHFPKFPLLPGVVQIDWLMRCLRRYLALAVDLKSIPRLKFMKPIVPMKPMRLELDYNPTTQQVSYRYLARGDQTIHASGKLNLEVRQ